MSAGMEVGAHQNSTENDESSFEADEKQGIIPPYNQDAFGNEEFAEVKYKVLKWWYVFEAVAQF